MKSESEIRASDIAAGKPTHTSTGTARSGHWPAVRHAHLLNEPICQWCGCKDHLEVHHKQPFHIHPELELDPKNLITLCEAGPTECHLKHGHLGNWKSFNPQIQTECDARRAAHKLGSE